MNIIVFTLFGLGLGGLYAMLGQGIVVAYKGSGVINFAHGAIAMYVTFTFSELRATGDLRLPLIDFLPGHLDVPVNISLSDGPLSFWPAFLGAMGMAVLLGLAMHFLVFRPLRNAPPLGKVIASVGILLYLQGIAILDDHFGSDTRQLETILPSKPLKNFLWSGKVYPREDLYLAGVAVIIGVLLWLVYKYTRFGLATRAAAGNEKGAILLGYSPDFLAGANWVLSAMLAGMAGIFAGQIAGTLTATRYTLLIVPALGAALIGGLSSIGLTTLGGLILGMTQSLVTYIASPSQGWIPNWARTGLTDAVPLVVIAVVLFIRGESIPIRGTVEQKRLPLAPQPVRIVTWSIIGPAVGAVAVMIFTGVWALAFTTSVITAILMLSYVVLTGYVGQISLAQLALAGVTGFLLLRLMSNGKRDPSGLFPFPISGPGLPLVVAFPIAIAGAIVVGLVIGLPALRIRGVQLAVVTIAAALTIESFYLGNTNLSGLRAGSDGKVPTPRFFGINLSSTGDSGLSDAKRFGHWTIIMLLLSCLVVVNIRRTGTGRRFLAVRANERAAAAAGIHVARTKLLAFGVAAGLAGVAGGMFSFQLGTISSANWAVLIGLAVLAFAYLGGITSVNGAIVGGMIAASGLVAYFGKFHFPNLDQYIVAIGGLGMIVTAIVNPEGIAPYFQPGFRLLGNNALHWTRQQWIRAAMRYGPWIVGGAVFGWVVWTRRANYTWWMVLVGVALALFIRSIIMQIYRGVTGQGAHAPAPLPPDTGPILAGAHGAATFQPPATEVPAEAETQVKA